MGEFGQSHSTWAKFWDFPDLEMGKKKAVIFIHTKKEMGKVEVWKIEHYHHQTSMPE